MLGRVTQHRGIRINNRVRTRTPSGAECGLRSKTRLFIAAVVDREISCHISLSGCSSVGAGAITISGGFRGASLCRRFGSEGSWTDAHFKNQRKILTCIITSNVPWARSAGSALELDDGRRILGPNTVAKLFCPILFCSWCSLTLNWTRQEQRKWIKWCKNSTI